MISDAAERAQRLLQCPVGCTFMVIVDRSRLPVDEAVTPRRAFAIAAAALSALNPWSGQFDQAIAQSLSQGARLEQLARRLVTHPGAAWWSEPIDREAQVWVGSGEFPHGGIGGTPGQDPSRQAAWEGYAERPVGWRITSTARDGLSCLDVVVASFVGDWMPRESSRCAVLPIGPDVRVYEVSGPAAWHALCREYPAVNRNPTSAAGSGALVPRWAGVAEQWEGVHLTFLGLLTTPFVTTESAAGRSSMWSWDAESTIWLRDDVLHADGSPERFALDEMGLRDSLDGLSTLDPLGILFDPNDPSVVLLTPSASRLRRLRLGWPRFKWPRLRRP